MSKKFLILVFIFAGFSFFVLKHTFTLLSPVFSGAPPYGLSENEFPEFGSLSWLANWERPDGPARVGLQVGHFENSELPEELEKHIGSTGSSGGGYTEIEINQMIAKATAEILEKNGVEVDILPATIPPSYWADVFISIHADGNPDSSVKGYKIASPWRDYTGNANSLVKLVKESYQATAKLPFDDNVTSNMRGYYAFAWWKYEHAIHPMTTAAIIETGFLTSSSDRTLLVNSPEIPAKGIADGIVSYLESVELL